MLIESQFFTLSDGTPLHVQMVESGHPVWLIVTHGIGEHLGRHQYLINLLKGSFNILFYDLRGHGKSGGRRAYVDRFSLYYKDLDEIIAMLRDEYAMKRLALFGHSMGGTITCGYVQEKRNDPLYPEKIFLSSPAIGLAGYSGIVMDYLPLSVFGGLASLPLSLELSKLVDLSYLSHDSKVGEDYRKDCLNCLHLHSKLILELILATKKIFSRPLRVKGSCFCAYATKDRVVSPNATKSYFQMMEHATIVEAFTGAYHEIHNEIPEYRVKYFRFLKDSLMGNTIEI